MNQGEQHQKYDFDIHEDEMVHSVEGFLEEEDIGPGEEGKQNAKEGSKNGDSSSFSIDSGHGVPDFSEESKGPKNERKGADELKPAPT